MPEKSRKNAKCFTGVSGEDEGCPCYKMEVSYGSVISEKVSELSVSARAD